MQLDPFLEQFSRLFIMIVGATLLAGLLWRYNYSRRKRRREAAWAVSKESQREE